jgi:hypothetical protein
MKMWGGRCKVSVSAGSPKIVRLKAALFLTIVAAGMVIAAICARMARRYRAAEFRDSQVSRILFFHRYIKPVFDWIAFQSYALLWLDHLLIVNSVIRALDAISQRINHWRWRIFLRCILVTSLFTLPIKLFPGVDNAVFEKLFPGPHPFQWAARFQPLLEGIEGVYIYLFDWFLTVLLLYFLVALLAPLEPRNLFPDIENALEFFVQKHKLFSVGLYFWSKKPDQPLVQSTIDESGWPEFAQDLHRQTLQLDRNFLVSTGQGVNSRVAAVFEDEGETGTSACCVHYRRFGKSAFVLALDQAADDLKARISTVKPIFCTFRRASAVWSTCVSRSSTVLLSFWAASLTTEIRMDDCAGFGFIPQRPPGGNTPCHSILLRE